MSKIKYVFCIAVIGFTVFLYQNCADQSFTVTQSSVDYSTSMSPSCIGDNNLIIVSIDQDIEGEISFKCKDSNTEFVNCNNYDLDGGVVKASDGNLVFSQLDNDSYSLTVQMLITPDNGDTVRDTFEINFERCESETNTQSTETTSTTETTTDTTECITCLSRITDSTCQVCSNPNSCTETPIAKTISCGSEGMSAYPLSTEPTCPTGNRILCNKTCYRGGSATCTADPSTCTTCPNGECGQPQTGQTCLSQITDSACQVCSNSNSCSESPSNKTITCGSGDMSAYPLSTRPACPTGELTLCGTTCYSGGSITCTANSATCTTCPNGECGQPQTGQTCLSQITDSACQVCSNPSSCTEAPSNKTITCGSGDMSAYPLSTRPACPTGELTLCGTTCYSGGSITCTANSATCTTCPNGECGQPQTGQTCLSQITDSACQVCSNSNSCSESPSNRTITCGSEDMAAYPLSSEPVCVTDSRTSCGITCYQGRSFKKYTRCSCEDCDLTSLCWFETYNANCGYECPTGISNNPHNGFSCPARGVTPPNCYDILDNLAPCR